MFKSELVKHSSGMESISDCDIVGIFRQGVIIEPKKGRSEHFAAEEQRLGVVRQLSTLNDKEWFVCGL